jgi:hypothetical protein
MNPFFKGVGIGLVTLFGSIVVGTLVAAGISWLVYFWVEAGWNIFPPNPWYN